MAHWKVKYIALQTFITALLPNKNDTVKKKNCQNLATQMLVLIKTTISSYFVPH